MNVLRLLLTFTTAYGIFFLGPGAVAARATPSSCSTCASNSSQVPYRDINGYVSTTLPAHESPEYQFASSDDGGVGVPQWIFAAGLILITVSIVEVVISSRKRK